MTWDTWNYQDGVLRAIEQARSYRGEHVDRIARKQSNGSPHMRDEQTGVIQALDGLLGGARFPNREALLSVLEQMLGAAPPHVTVDHVSAYERGYYGELRMRLAGAKKHLEKEMGGGKATPHPN